VRAPDIADVDDLTKEFIAESQEGLDRIPGIRSMCEFRYANLCLPIPHLPVFDLVMLRNVLLYFSQQDRRAVFDEIYRKMVPGGVSAFRERGAG
jgi:chemotaxis protein methyltransferase CheR